MTYVRTIYSLCLVFLTCTAHAQSAAARAPSEQQLVAKILDLVDSEDAAVGLLDRALKEMLQNTVETMEKIGMPAAQKEALLPTLIADVKATSDELHPLARASATKFAKSTAGKKLADSFSSAELGQIAKFLEDPLHIRFMTFLPQMQNELNSLVLKDTQAVVTPKLNELNKTLAARIKTARDNAAQAKK